MKGLLPGAALALLLGGASLWAQEDSAPPPVITTENESPPEIPRIPPEAGPEDMPAPDIQQPMMPPPGPLGPPRRPGRSSRPREEGAKPATPAAPARSARPAKPGEAKAEAPAAGELNIDYVDEPILDVLRSIATAYRLSIIPEKDIGDVKVTIHLEKIPVLEGLEKLCKSHGLELVREGSVFRVRRQQEATQSMLQLRGGKLYLDVKNKPIRDFVRDFGEKTGINIVPGQGLRGQVTGQLRGVKPLDGLKALMAANNYSLRQRSGVWLVENVDSAEASAPTMPGRRRPMPGLASGGGEVDVHDGKVNLSARNASLAEVLREIAEQSGLNYAVIGDVSGMVNAQLREVPVDEALTAVLKGTRFTFIRRNGSLLIGDRNPNTPSGQALSSAELMYLKFIRAENLEKLLPKSGQENVKVVKEQNALLITGTGEEIQSARELIEKVDLPTPQVLLEVVVVEYNRTKDSQLGVAAGKSAELGPNVNLEAGFSGIREEFRKGSFRGAIGILPPRFDLSLRALESQDKARVLAMPKITTLNGNKAELRVTRTFYFQVSSVTKDGFQNNDFRAIDDGITIEITPWITRHGEVNVNITPSIKTAGQASGNEPAPITNRSITTNVRLMDGETIALGGLITSQEDNQRRYVPILGSIPLLKYLFSYRRLRKINTELVIYVTPHVLKPESQGVLLQNEFKAMEKRGGNVKPEEFILNNKAAPRDDNPAPDAEPAVEPDSAAAPAPSPEPAKSSPAPAAP